MKHIISFLVLAATLSMGVTSFAGDVEWVSTDTARKQGTLQSDAPSVDDPYMNKTPSQGAYQGNAKTQGGYDTTCTTDQCKRAEKRQLNESTTWRDDVKSGEKVGGY